ncbi:urease accessory protein UreE [Limimaricola pyoseonensis]|uniref:Urease accessory protein UreE n=1 Tax=Limimaricola pyoseonensis TaxID=521013 RepID=A0A1G7KRR0_9RHOB|nr:urease accessory protein UreE [Limimaricola pyoseonensis]SDF39928.1 urease accessory protein [Limimaricola pyoseonensis]
MTDLPTARTLHRKGHWTGQAETCALDYEGRFLRRRVLVTTSGLSVLVDLPQTVSLEAGDALELGDGRRVAILAAPEALTEVRGDLARLAWHVGNRHTPCEIHADRLVIRRDKVIAHMLDHLGAELRDVTGPFSPEGGAYGHGRTHAHEHGHSAHAH